MNIKTWNAARGLVAYYPSGGTDSLKALNMEHILTCSYNLRVSSALAKVIENTLSTVFVGPFCMHGWFGCNIYQCGSLGYLGWSGWPRGFSILPSLFHDTFLKLFFHQIEPCFLLVEMWVQWTKSYLLFTAC